MVTTLDGRRAMWAQASLLLGSTLLVAMFSLCFSLRSWSVHGGR